MRRLGELTQPDNEIDPAPHSHPHAFDIFVHPPVSQAGPLFEGNTIVVEPRMGGLCPLQPFIKYLAARDTPFPLHLSGLLPQDHPPPTLVLGFQTVRTFGSAGTSVPRGTVSLLRRYPLCPTLY